MEQVPHLLWHKAAPWLQLCSATSGIDSSEYWREKASNIAQIQSKTSLIELHHAIVGSLLLAPLFKKERKEEEAKKLTKSGNNCGNLISPQLLL